MNQSKITETDSNHQNLEQMPVREILECMNREDEQVAAAVRESIPMIDKWVIECTNRMRNGGRLFYLGAGTSGRLGILDASECPPTFGVEQGKVIGLIAGGDQAIRKAVEFAEDDTQQGWKDLLAYNLSPIDSVTGIAASGSTPYVIGALEQCRKNGIRTACITCNPNSEIILHADVPIVAQVGPEFLTGSTRLKSGTAQKLILNMISTSIMIQLGHVKGNKMVDMQLSNHKLIDRGERMIMNETGVDQTTASRLLKEYGNVRKAIDSINRKDHGAHS